MGHEQILRASQMGHFEMAMVSLWCASLSTNTRFRLYSCKGHMMLNQQKELPNDFSGQVGGPYGP